MHRLNEFSDSLVPNEKADKISRAMLLARKQRERGEMTPDQFCAVIACQVAEACKEGHYEYLQRPEPSKAAKEFWAMTSEAKGKLRRKDQEEFERLQGAAIRAQDDALYVQVENNEIEASLLENGCVLKWAGLDTQRTVLRETLRRFYRAKMVEINRR